MDQNLIMEKDAVRVNAADVQSVLARHMLVDGFDITLDLENSTGGYIYDSKRKKNYIDFFTFVASNPLGMNHPKLRTDEFIRRIGEVAITKPSLSDVYAIEQAEFVETFFKIAVPDYFKHSFYIEGGALAVENTLKAAFDWKVQKNFKKGYQSPKGHQVIHFLQSFHGRSGYTMCLTNTDPNKVKWFPIFNWPRVLNPKMIFPMNDENLAKVIEAENESIRQIKDAIVNNKDDIAALIIEPIQGEGGDNQFRREFFLQLREICDENEIMLIFDEVQTGIALTGKWWAHEHYVRPDLISFGKKTQVCGVLSTSRIDEIEENVFRKPSRINSTWGGNIVDMVRFTKILQIIQEEDYVGNCERMGVILSKRINDLLEEFPDKLSNGRGVGLFAAFDCESPELRNKIISKAFENGLMILGSGEKSIRFRPPVCVNENQIDEGMNVIRKTLTDLI